MGYSMAMIHLLPRKKPHFVILCGGRSGSHLLVDLLNSHSELHVDGELLHPNAVPAMVAPRFYLRGHRLRHRWKIHGFKVSLTELQTQGLEPRAFFEDLTRSGGYVIHLHRSNAFRSAISSSIAHTRGRHRDTVVNPLQGQTFHLNCNAVVENVTQRVSAQETEFDVMRDLPHLSLNYEEDLLWANCHQLTCDRVFQHLDCGSQLVTTSHSKRSPADLSEVIGNYDDLVSALQAAGLSRFLSDGEYKSHAMSAA